MGLRGAAAGTAVEDWDKLPEKRPDPSPITENRAYGLSQ